MINTYLELQELFFLSLKNIYDEREIRSLFHIYVEHKSGLTKEKLYLNLHEKIKTEDIKTIYSDIRRLEKGEPIQYITGGTVFYGIPLTVDSSVLIPRQETEELVDLIIKENQEKEGLKIIDIGTGSGAIAISLEKHLKNAEISGLDISKEALQVARRNARHSRSKAEFKEFDLLNHALFRDTITDIDIIVSNPPYIPESEKASLPVNVKEYEPEYALFVPDETPILFYQKIAEFGGNILNPGGKIYVETHELFHDEIERAFDFFGYQDFRKIKDLNGKPRIFFCRKK